MKHQNIFFRSSVFSQNEGKEKKYQPEQNSQNVFWLRKVLNEEISVVG